MPCFVVIELDVYLWFFGHEAGEDERVNAAVEDICRCRRLQTPCGSMGRKPNRTIEKDRTRMKAKAKKTRQRVARVTEGSGNVFADLGLPNPEQELLKAQLTLQIYHPQ
jgi:hypothetical protein